MGVDEAVERIEPACNRHAGGDTPLPDRDALASYLALVAKSSNVRNISLTLVVGGKRLSIVASPQSSLEERFFIGCVTKALVAAVVLELDAARILDIESPIGVFLPEFEGAAIGEKVQIRHLLSSTTGYVGFPFFDASTTEMTWPQLVAALRAEAPVFAAGTVYSLDHSNQALLAEIVRRSTGCLWQDLVDKTFGTPLFGRSLYDNHDRQKLWGAAAASTSLSADELATLGEALMTGRGPACGRPILSPATASRLTEGVVLNPPLSGARVVHWLPVGHGLGMPLYHSGLFGECGKGKGQLSSLRVKPDRDLTVAVCIDSGDPRVRHRVLDAALAEVGIPVREQNPRVPLNVPLKDVSGRYVGLRGYEVRIDAVNGRLCISMKGPDTTVTRYYCETHDDGTLEIEKDQPVAGISIFADPASGAPSLLIGVHALRRS